MNCSLCKSVIDKGVMIAETSPGFISADVLNKIIYCKSCFKREFINDR